MPHGTPDWGVTAPKTTVYTLQDMGELAARLGSIVTFDRRGDVIWMDNFDSGLCKVFESCTGSGCDVYPSCDFPFSGGLHLVLKTGSAAGNRAGISRNLYLPPLGPVGVEIAFAPQTNMRSMLLGITHFDGVNSHAYYINYYLTTGELYILDSTSGEVVLGTPGVVYTLEPTYCIIKLVVDLSVDTYTRVIFNDVGYVASQYKALVTANPLSPNMRVTATAYTDVDAAVLVPIDNLIITQNEPV